MKSINDILPIEITLGKAALGLVTVAFAAGMIVPVRASGEPTWGTTYHNPDQTMYVCVCDGGDMCAPCTNLET